MVSNMKFKNKKGVIVETRNAYEESILKSNPNYTEIIENNTNSIKKEEDKAENEIKTQKTAKKDGK